MKSKNSAYIFLVVAMLLVGCNIGFGKSIIKVMPVLVFALLRFVIAVTILAPQYWKPGPRFTKNEWLNLFAQAFFGTFLFTLCMLYGVQRTSVTAAGVITSTIPAAAAILSWVILKERINRSTLLSILLAITGVAILSLFKPDDGQSSTTGNLFLLFAVFCEATYVVLSKRLTQSISPMRITAYSHLFGLLLMLPFGMYAALSFDFSTVAPEIWGLIVWYSLAASVFSFWLWMAGIKHLQANIAGIFTAVVPIAAAFIGVVFLNETLSWAHLLALSCVLLGIAIASWPAERHPEVQPV